MNSMSLNNLWSYLQGLSLSASNQRWLGERLIEASAAQATAINEEESKLKKLNALFGVWRGQDGEQIEAAVLRHKMVMVTDNVDHLGRIRGIEIEDWNTDEPKV